MKQTEILLELVRAAVLDAPPAIPKDVKVDWNALMDSAAGHKVLAWVWDSICRLPAEQQPSRQERINWGLSAQEIWDSYYSQKKVLEDMISVCNKEGIRLLLLKGLGVSAIYPKPESRPSGDIDIFLFDDFEKGKELFGAFYLGTTILHDKYCYKGVRIENHKMFVHPDFYGGRLAGDYLLKKASSQIVVSTGGYYTFSPLDNYVYLMVHALNHVQYSESNCLFPLRSFVDLAVFIYHYKSELPSQTVAQLFKQLHLEKSFDLVLYFSEWLLNVELTSYHLGLISNHDMNMIRHFFLSDGLTMVIPENESFRVRSRLLWKRFCVYRVIFRYLPKYNRNLLIVHIRGQLRIIRECFFNR